MGPFDFSSVRFSRSVVSDSLGPHGLQHASLPFDLLNFKSKKAGISLAVQQLRLVFPMWRVQVRSLIGELRSHMSHGQKTQT